MKKSGHLSASYRIMLKVMIENRPGMLGRISSAIGKAGGDIGSVDMVDVQNGRITREISVNTTNEIHAQKIVSAVQKVKGVDVINFSDRTFLVHQGGKISIAPKFSLKSRDDLSMVYTPGVGRISSAIHRDPNRVWSLTMKSNSVAIVTDGSAVLGLGNLGPLGALPVMEGKSMIFKEFADIDAFPICLNTQDTEEIIETVKRISPVFGGINLEDISSPRCFEIKRRLSTELDIPVMHDDQHGTAIVTLAGLINALKIVKKKFRTLKVVMIGAGAAGRAVANILLRVGVRNIIAFDRAGSIYRGRLDHMNHVSEWFSRKTNPKVYKGSLSGALKGADVFIGLSSSGTVRARELKHMARDPIIFALANPTPEVMPEDVSSFARIIATGRSDFPNQVNNALGYPGIFRGALDVHAQKINKEMMLAAAKAIADSVHSSELHEDYIIPSVFHSSVVQNVAKAVAKAARKTKVARQIR